MVILIQALHWNLKYSGVTAIEALVHHFTRDFLWNLTPTKHEAEAFMYVFFLYSIS